MTEARDNVHCRVTNPNHDILPIIMDRPEEPDAIKESLTPGIDHKHLNSYRETTIEVPVKPRVRNP